MASFTHTNPMHDVKALEAQVKKLQEENAKLKATLGDVHVFVGAFQSKLQGAKAEADSKVSEASQRIQALLHEIMVLKSDVVLRDRALDGIYSERLGVEHENSELRKQLAALTAARYGTEMHASGVNIATLEVDLDSANERAGTAEIENQTLQSQVQALQAEVATLEVDLDSANERADTAEIENQTLQSQVQDLQAEVATLRAQLAEQTPTEPPVSEPAQPQDPDQRIKNAVRTLLYPVRNHIFTRIANLGENNPKEKANLNEKIGALEAIIEGAPAALKKMSFETWSDNVKNNRTLDKHASTGFFTWFYNAVITIFSNVGTVKQTATVFKNTEENANLEAVKDAAADRANA